MNASTDSKPQTAPPAKRKEIRVVLVILALVVASAGLSALGYHFLIGQYFRGTDDAYLHSDSVTVSSKVGGYVTQVMIRDNEDVHAGQPLVIINPRDYRAQVDQTKLRYELAALTGLAPGAPDDRLAMSDSSKAPIPLPPVILSVVDPATMLRQRPDIRAAERALASSQAQIGRAMAARFPSISLFGVIGISGTQARKLTQLDDFSSVVASRLSWYILDFGRVSADIREAEGGVMRRRPNSDPPC